MNFHGFDVNIVGITPSIQKNSYDIHFSVDGYPTQEPYYEYVYDEAKPEESWFSDNPEEFGDYVDASDDPNIFKKFSDDFNKLVKRYLLLQGLKGSAKDNWNDILEEEYGNYYKVLRRATDEEINNYLKRGYTLPEDIKGAWLMHIIEGGEDRNNLVFHIPKRWERPYVIFMTDDYIFDGAVSEDSPVAKAIKHFELTSGISNKAKETWSDILEFEQIVLEAVLSLWDIRYATPKEVKKLMDKRKQGGLLDFSKVWMVTTKDNGVQAYFVKSKEKDNTIVMFNPETYDWYGYMYPGYDIYDSIMHWELTQGLKGTAKDNWENILS